MSTASIFSGVILLVFGLVWIAALLYFRKKQARSLLFLVFFSLFYVYLYKVLDYTLFQYQALVAIKYFSPELILMGQTAGDELNLLPLVGLRQDDLQTSLLNILLFVPFGFGLPFISPFGATKTVLVGMCFSIAIELLQWLSGRIAGTWFRITDINDVIFNTLGAAIGYLLFVGFVRVCRRIVYKRSVSTNALVEYVITRPQLPQA